MLDLDPMYIPLPGPRLLIGTLLSAFCCTVGAWLIFIQWWAKIMEFTKLTKQYHSLAPGGFLLAIGIYLLPTPTNTGTWGGQFEHIGIVTSTIKPFWWVALAIDPFNILIILGIIFVFIPYLFREYLQPLFGKPCNRPNSRKKYLSISHIEQTGDFAFKMWFSWRDKGSIGYTESADSLNWSEPQIVLAPCDSGWEERVNRCCIAHKDSQYYMWYTGQTNDRSFIGLALSDDGLEWRRVSKKPVLEPSTDWEKAAVMYPNVRWDEEAQLFKMYYSAGEQNAPNAIGYATSPNGINWTRYANNPIFTADPRCKWEQHRVTACQVIPYDGWFYMFYVGFENEKTAHICIARSLDGLTNWERGRGPFFFPSYQKAWDGKTCYKPFVIDKSKSWYLWYNDTNGAVKKIFIFKYLTASDYFEKETKP